MTGCARLGGLVPVARRSRRRELSTAVAACVVGQAELEAGHQTAGHDAGRAFGLWSTGAQ